MRALFLCLSLIVSLFLSLYLCLFLCLSHTHTLTYLPFLFLLSVAFKRLQKQFY